MTSYSRIEFFERVLGQLAAPATPASLQALVAVAVGEGSAARWNPIDTILPMPGATPFNTFGPNGRYHVWDYPDAPTGILATARTITAWPVVLAALRDASSAALIIRAYDESDGVGGPLYDEVLPYVVGTWPRYGDVLVAGSVGPAPPATIGEPEMILFEYPAGTYYTTGGVGAKHVATPGDLVAYKAAGVPIVPISDEEAENYLKGTSGPISAAAAAGADDMAPAAETPAAPAPDAVASPTT